MLLKSPRVEICERWSWLVAHHSVCVRVCVCVCITDRKRTEYSAWQRNPGTSITQSEPSAVVWSAQKKRKERNTHTRASYPTRAAVRTTPSLLHYKEGLGGVAHSV